MHPATFAVLAFVAQTAIVFAGNSRLFGVLKPGSGWYTNVEMAQMYASLVTPAKFAFAIWGLIYMWEAAAMCYLWLRPWASFSTGWDVTMWLSANACQALWAPLFATERLGLSAIALAGIAVSLVLLGISLGPASGLDSAFLATPVWVHAGWTTAASLVNFNLVLAASNASAATQLAMAFASSFAALVIGLSIVILVGSSHAAASAFAPLPFAFAISWALYAIRAELREPDMIKQSEAYQAVGEVGRVALEKGLAGCVISLVAGSLAMALALSAARNVGSSSVL